MSTAEAVAAAARGGFDIVLMDVRMPEMGGLEARRRIRALAGGGLPIVALTANPLAEERQRCLAAGMEGYLAKPLEPETLYAELCRRLQFPAGETGGRRPVSAPLAAERALPGFDGVSVVEKNDPRAQRRNSVAGHRGEARIVYCASRRRVDETAAWLRGEGLRALPYHAGMDPGARREHQARFLRELRWSPASERTNSPATAAPL